MPNRSANPSPATPMNVKIAAPSATTIDASTTAGRSGRPLGVMTPSWSFEDRREDRMPPRAPACETNGGIRM